MITTIFDLFLLFSSLHGFLFSAFLLRNYANNSYGIRYLNFLILAVALNNLQSWLLALDFPLLDYIQMPWHFLLAPMFYTFLLNYLDLKNKYFNVLKVFTPFFILSIILQVSYLTFLRESTSRGEFERIYEKYTGIEELVSYVSSLALFAYSLFIIKNYNKKRYDFELFDDLKWIRNFIVFASISYIVWGAALLMKFVLNFENFIVFYYPLRVLTTILIYWLGYELLITIRKIKERKIIRKKHPREHKKAYNLDSKYNNLLAHIENNTRFLDPIISIDGLAQECEMSSSQLSKIINEHTGQNFNQFINGLRVNYSKKLLLDTSYSKFTITSIALESGFNSKSTFYNAFKKHTGMTPSEFKKIDILTETNIDI
ncbi:AraC family transcriptional regulator [Aquimarina sp. RZ0]|uniref:helix-turn-helix domain-containing protein n=1 Tax=Aquimarina sp. RZ0 TaxID=2607730 RepID=UPI0011F2C542|nr:response regulator transcription factor [Aquimarina sp. RZ0]KAA1244896.1 helix-turn-helix transcriptional regulator [Aquimarina sp. RZ0]